MNSLIRFSMKNAVAVFILILLLIGGGLYSMSRMKMEQYPAVDIPYYHIGIAYPGASPEQVMRDIGEKLEKQLGNIDGVEDVYSSAYSSYYQATVKFGLAADMEKGEREVRDAIAKTKLPDTAKDPEYFEENLNGGVYEMAVSGDDQEEIQRYTEQSLLPALRSVDGIERLEVNGTHEKKVYVRVRSEVLREKGLTLDQVQQMIIANNLSVPVGDLHTESQILPIRITNSLKTLDDIRNMKLMRVAPNTSDSKGSSIQTFALGDIADIVYSAQGEGISQLDGKPAISIAVIQKSGEDAVGIAKRVKEEVAKLSHSLPKGMSTAVLYDQSVEIEKSVNSMLREVALGALMAVIVTLLFLRNLRSTLIAVISIPLSMFASFIVLGYLGYTLNMMTLAGIAVAIGRVVDDSIVVIENVFRRVRSSTERNAQLVEGATREVTSAITSSTLTTVAVFLPLAFVPGIVGKVFVPLAWTIVISLLFSLLVAVTVVPLLSRLFLLKLKHKEHRENGIQRMYRHALKWALAHRAATLLVALLLLAGSVTIPAMGLLGFNFLPSEKVHNYKVNIKMALGSNIDKTQEVTNVVVKAIHGQQDVERVHVNIGNEGANVSFAMNEQADTDKAAKELTAAFERIEGARSITLIGTGSINVGSGLNIIVNGPNIETIKKGTEQMVAALKQVPGLADVRSSAEGEKPEVSIEFDEAKLAGNGLTPAQVAMSLHGIIEGTTITKVQVDDQTTDLVLSLDTGDQATLGQLSAQKITNPLGVQVALGDLGTIKQVKNPISISHLNQKQYLQVFGAITDSNTGKVSGDAAKAIDALKLPDGVTWSSEGAAKEMNDGFMNMGIALGISIVLVYFVMLLAFGEALTPFVILFAIPFSLTGALAGLYLVGEPIGMPAMIGMLMLNGIVVTNAIVLLDRVKQNTLAGMGKHQALIEAGVTRVRPILMTAIATIGALFPLALSTEAGLVSRSLAVVVIGGLTTSTLLTLIIVPVLYSLIRRESKAKLEAHGAAKVA